MKVILSVSQQQLSACISNFLNEFTNEGGRAKSSHNIIKRTKAAERTDKTVTPLLLQNLADVAYTADGELVIVELVS